MAFAIYIARRLASRNASPFAAFAAIHLLAARLAGFLAPFGASASAVKKAEAAVLRIAKTRLRRRSPKSQIVTIRTAAQSHERPPLPPSRPRKARPRKPVPPGQGSLF
jgi:hypothetical protein